MSGEKTEQPTPKKLRDARQKGQVAKSKEVVSAALILTIMAMLMGLSDYYLEHLGKLMLIPEQASALPFQQALDVMGENLFQELVYLLLPLLSVAALMTILSHVGQYGFLLSGESVKPDIKKINPVEGAKKIFSIKNLMEFVKSLLKVCLLSLLVWVTIEGNLKPLLQLPRCGALCIMPLVGDMLGQLMAVCALGFVVIAIADYAFEHHQHIKQLKMSKDEVKREYKEMEGSPEIKSKRRQFHQELQSSTMRADVKRSSVIVANPTHIAIGIRYEKGETPLPLVTLKYTDAQALMVRRIAEEEGIPVLQRIPLARALHRDALIDHYIPAEQIEAAAEVLRWLEQWWQKEEAGW
ncbi:type III secretion system export apparatus subunit SctU [Aeromonas schubertii]